MAELKIKADSGGGTVAFKGPATTTSNAAIQLTLPVDDGTANQYLKTNGSGVLSWATVDTSIADDSIVEAKLDVSNAPTNGQFLQAQSAEGGGLTWATPGGGKVLKVQHASTTSTVNHPNNSSAYVDTGLTMDFTATASDSTLIILVAQNAAEFRSAGGAGWAVQLHRDSSSLISEDRALTGYKELSGYAFLQHSMSAGDTSSHTFKTKTANHHSDSSGSAQYSGSPSTMTIWEISA